MNFSHILAQWGLPQKMTLDIALLLVVMFATFVFGMLVGRYKLVTVLINIYVAIAILSVVSIKILPDYLFRLALFFCIIIVFTLLSKKMFETPIAGMGKNSLWQIFIVSFFEIMLIISSILMILPKKTALGYVSLSAYEYIVSEYAALFWMVIPLIVLFIINKKFRR